MSLVERLPSARTLSHLLRLHPIAEIARRYRLSPNTVESWIYPVLIEPQQRYCGERLPQRLSWLVQALEREGFTDRRLAALFRVSASAFSRWRQRHPMMHAAA